MKYLKIPVNASNLEKVPFFTPKGYSRVFGSFALSLSFSSLQLRTTGLIRLIKSSELIALINKKTIDPVDLID